MTESPERICPSCSATFRAEKTCPHCELPLRDLGTAETVRAGSSPARQAGGATEIVCTLGRFRVVSLLGRGGMGAVYKARQEELRRWVALKFLLPSAGGESAEEIERFRREARMAARAAHPNIAAIYEVGDLDVPSDSPLGLPAGRHRYLAMQFVDGETLQHASLTLQEKVRALRDAAHAVHHAHSLEIIHRDLKPQNIMVTRADSPAGEGVNHIYVMDFGLARVWRQESNLTATGTAIGTPAYMAPEQARGEVRRLTPAADVYALGAVLYYLLAGQPPFTGESVLSVLRKVEALEPRAPRRILSSIPRDLENVCLKAMEKEPRKRYPSAKEFAEELERYLQGESVRARPVGPAGRVWRRARRRPAVAGILLVALLGTVAAAIFGGSQYAERLTSEREAEESETSRRQEQEARQRRRSLARPAYDRAGEKYGCALQVRFVSMKGREASEALLAEAFREVDQALAVDSQFAEAFLLRAQIARLRGQHESSLKDLDRALAIQPALSSALLLRGRVRLSQYLDRRVGSVVKTGSIFGVELSGHREEATEATELCRSAVADLEAADRLRRGSEGEASAAGLLAFARREYREAIRLLSDFLQRDPNDRECRLYLLDSLNAMGRYEEAQAVCEEGLELAPAWLRGWCELSRTHNRLGETEAALEAARKAVELDASSMEALKARWSARGGAGDLKGAAEDLELLLEKRPESPTLHYNRALIALHQEDYECVIRHALRCLELDVNLNLACNLLFSAYGVVGRLEEALQVAERLLETEPHLYEARFFRYLFRSALGDPDADEELARMSALEPPDAIAYNNRATLFAKLKRHKEAMQDMDQAVRLEPASQMFAVNRAELYTLAGHRQEAIAGLRRYLEAHAEDAMVRNMLGLKLVQEQDYQQARREFEEAVRLAPKRADFHHNLGYTEERLGAPQKAASCYDRAIELDPDHLQARKARRELRQRRGDLPGATEDADAVARLEAERATEATDWKDERVDFFFRLNRLWKKTRELLASGFRGVDRMDFLRSYDPWKQAAKPDASALAAIEKNLQTWLAAHKQEEGCEWRVLHLLSEMACDRNEPELAAEQLERAIAVYPDRSYSLPEKESGFPQLVNARAMLEWDREGAEAAMRYATDLLASDRRYHYFEPEAWTERFTREGVAEAIPELYTTVKAAYEKRAETFPELAEKARRFAAGLK